MADEQRGQPTPEAQQPSGLGLSDLSMNVVAASSTEEPTQLGPRAGRTALFVVAVLIVVVLVAFVARSLTTLSPGKEAEARLRAKLQGLSVWQTGLLQGASYVSSGELRVDFSTQVSVGSDESRREIKDATVAVMKVLMEERPNRDLKITGYQGDQEILRAEYRSKGALVGPSGQVEPEILIHMAGEEGGLSGAVSESTRSATR
jgi:hypothetical protein